MAGTNGLLRVVLIDGSDNIEPSELAQVAQMVREIAGASRAEERLLVVTLGGGKEVDLLPVFSGCNRAHADPLGGSIYAEKTAAAFVAKLEEWLPSLRRAERISSPIYEAHERLLFRSDVAAAARTELWIVSDFLQNSPTWSHYPGSPSYHRPKSDLLPEIPQVPRRWDAVTLVELQRPSARQFQTRAHLAHVVAHFGRFAKAAPVVRKF